MSLPATRVPVKLNTGAEMPLLGFGTWQAKKGEVAAATETAIKAGFRHIDGAMIYRNESEVGEAIAKCIAEGVVKREDLFVTTKLWNINHEPSEVRAACEASLKRLGLSYVDLYLIHWPVSWVNNQGGDHMNIADEVVFPKSDKGGMLQRPVPMRATWKAMEELVDAGLVKAIGLSNCSVEQVVDVIEGARIIPAAHQVECHPACPQNELAELHAKHGIVLQAYCPLGIGMQDVTKSLLQHPEIKRIADAAGMNSPAELLLRWNISKGNITLSKSVTPERIAENAATTSAPLPSDVMAALDNFGKKFPLRVCNPPMMHEEAGPFFHDGRPAQY